MENALKELEKANTKVSILLDILVYLQVNKINTYEGVMSYLRQLKDAEMKYADAISKILEGFTKNG